MQVRERTDGELAGGIFGVDNCTGLASLPQRTSLRRANQHLGCASLSRAGRWRSALAFFSGLTPFQSATTWNSPALRKRIPVLHEDVVYAERGHAEYKGLKQKTSPDHAQQTFYHVIYNMQLPFNEGECTAQAGDQESFT